MAGREDYRIFIGGLGWNTSQRHLEDAFSRYGKILDSLVMVDRDTGRPRGFGFLTFVDCRAMENAIRDMHGRELDGRIISVNKAEPKIGAVDPYDGYGDHQSDSRDRFSDRADECFKCGRFGHWARDCLSTGGGRYSSQSDYGRGGPPSDRDYDRYYDYPSRERFDSRGAYGSRDRFSSERYPPSDRYPQIGYGYGYGRDWEYEREGIFRGADRYGSGGPARYDKGSYRDRAQAHPYGPPPRRRGRR